jgi:hypothetical protein
MEQAQPQAQAALFDVGPGKVTSPVSGTFGSPAWPGPAAHKPRFTTKSTIVHPEPSATLIDPSAL